MNPPNLLREIEVSIPLHVIPKLKEVVGTN